MALPRQDCLGATLSKALVSSLSDTKLFLPASQLPLLFTATNVTAELRRIPSRYKQIDTPEPEEQLADLVRFIVDDAKKVFGAALRSSSESGFGLISIMKEFRRLNFNDDVLPIKETPCAKSGIFDDCSHSQALAVFHDRDLWSYDTIQKFCEEQWTFLAPVFTESAAKQELPLNSILPYTWMDTVSKHSHFSRVTKAKIRTDHLAVVETVRTPLMQGFQHPENNFRQSETELEVAVKELIKSPNTKDPDLKKAWDVEAEALLAISNLKNNHLIRRIAAFSRQSRYFLIFEWANGGSLHEFWKNNPKPTLSHQLVQDVVIQLLGLSRALRALHNNDKSESNIGTGNWRHGDLKPDNILRFRGPNTPEDSLGTLKIADLGLAKLHDVDTNLRADPTSQKCGTLKYEPPEALHPHRSPRSRRYDIWSMGCIILESIIWLLYGYEGLEVFNGEAVDDPNRETVFYKVDNQGQGTVNNIATRWMRRIRDEDPECKQDSAIRALLEVVEKKLLVVETETAGENQTGPRRTAPELCDDLERIKTLSEQDERYSFTGSSRDQNLKLTPVKSSRLLAPGGAVPRPRTGQPSSQAGEQIFAVPDPNVSTSDRTIFSGM